MKVAGIHPTGHDSCVVEIDLHEQKITASTLERFSRKKHDARYVAKLADFDWKPQGHIKVSLCEYIRKQVSLILGKLNYFKDAMK